MSRVSQHRQTLLTQSGTPLWNGYVNMLKILESVFLSPRHWVLEFLQNAEDAHAKKFSIKVETDRLIVYNDGDRFTDDDFAAICDVNSRKLPSLGFRGYLGIGFKSIFRITSRVEIHSGDYHFCFDKEHWRGEIKSEKGSISAVPWEVLPIETEPTELPKGYTTAFCIPLSDVKGRGMLKEIDEFLSGSDFPKEAILLLKNVDTIEIETPKASFLITKHLEESKELSKGKMERVTVKRDSQIPSRIEDAHYLVVRTVIPLIPMSRRTKKQSVCAGPMYPNGRSVLFSGWMPMRTFRP